MSYVKNAGAPGGIRKCRLPGSRAEAADWDARQWLIDTDLWDGSVGMTPEIRPVADTPHPDADANHYGDSITDTVLSRVLVT